MIYSLKDDIVKLKVRRSITVYADNNTFPYVSVYCAEHCVVVVLLPVSTTDMGRQLIDMYTQLVLVHARYFIT